MKVFIIIILVFLLLRVLAKYLFPALLRLYVKRVTRKFYNGMNPGEQEYHQDKEGEIRINKQETKTKSRSRDTGEYVDYEEIK